MRIEDLPLADIIANVPEMEVIEDERERLGYVLVKCPHDDGSDDHALFFCNPWNGLPARAYCLSAKCRDVTTAEFIELFGESAAKSTRH